MTNSVNPPGRGLRWQKRSRIYCQHRQSGGGNTAAPGSAPRPCPSLRPPAAGTCPAPHNKRGRGGAGAAAGAEEGSRQARSPQGRRGQRHTHTDLAPHGRVPRARAAAGRAGSRRRQGGSSAAERSGAEAKRLSGRGCLSSRRLPQCRGRQRERIPPRRPRPSRLRAGRPADSAPCGCCWRRAGERCPTGKRGEPQPRRPRRPPVPQPSPAGGWVGMCARVWRVLQAHAKETERKREMHTHRSVCGTARSPRQAVVSPHSWEVRLAPRRRRPRSFSRARPLPAARWRPLLSSEHAHPRDNTACAPARRQRGPLPGGGTAAATQPIARAGPPD